MLKVFSELVRNFGRKSAGAESVRRTPLYAVSRYAGVLHGTFQTWKTQFILAGRCGASSGGPRGCGDLRWRRVGIDQDLPVPWRGHLHQMRLCRRLSDLKSCQYSATVIIGDDDIIHLYGTAEGTGVVFPQPQRICGFFCEFGLCKCSDIIIIIIIITPMKFILCLFWPQIWILTPAYYAANRSYTDDSILSAAVQRLYH